MIEAIKQIVNWLKRKVKKILVVLGVVGTAMAAGGSLTITSPDITIDKLPQKYNSSQIKQEYQLIDGARLKKVIKDDWRDRVIVEVGKKKKIFQQGVFGGKTLEVFTPSLKMTRWDEVNFELDPEPIIGSIPLKNRKLNFIGKKIKYITPKKELHFYNIEPNEKLREGGYEFEVILKEKPSTNKLEFTIKTKGLKFYYQPPLTEEIKVGDEDGRIVKVTETDAYAKNEKGELISVTHRPENVVGSYAVYHATKGAISNVKGGKLYRAGKAFHIYRPRIEDANGNWTWGKLNIDEKKGILTIEIDQNFLDKAVYPVKIDPTFGCTAVGGTCGYFDFDGSKFTAPEDGTVTSISMYLSSGTSDINFGYYNDNSGVVGTHVAHGTAISNSPTTDWKTIDVSGSVTGNNVYWLIGQSSTGSVYDCYDSGGNDQEAFDDSWTFDDWSDNPNVLAYFDSVVSIYCTYTEGGGGEEEAPKMQSIIIE